MRIRSGIRVLACLCALVALSVFPACGRVGNATPDGTPAVDAGSGDAIGDTIGDALRYTDEDAPPDAPQPVDAPAGDATQNDTLPDVSASDLPTLGMGVIAGIVVDLVGKPLGGAQVEAEGATATTGADGRFRLEGLPDGTRLPVRARVAGMTTAHALADLSDGLARLRLVVAPTSSGEIADASAGGTVTGTDGVEIRFSGSFVDAQGNQASGPVAVRWAQSLAADLLPAAPVLSDGYGQRLEARSLLALEVEQAGEPVTFIGSVEVTLPAGSAPGEGATPQGLWTYDESAAHWRAEGQVGLAGDRLVLELPHLSWWMAGGPAAASGCATGTVTLADGSVAAGASLYATGVDYLGNNATTADASGRFCLLVAATGTTRIAFWYEATDGQTLYGESLSVLSGESGVCGTDGCRDLGTLVLTAPDTDDDGDGVADVDGDCDDADPDVRPGALEACDGRDTDCDGAVPVDELDADHDGVTACGGDCDDAQATVFTGATEWCDGLDNDCDGDLPGDEKDHDEDGSPECAGDCDDENPARFPGAPETCNGLDDDCDGSVPEVEADGDGDGQPVCGGDCDDGDSRRRFATGEACDGVDSDCDGVVPPAELDADGDGVAECGGDCDDGDPLVHPGATERCNGTDDDCDGAVPANESDGDGDGSVACAGDCDDTDAARAPGQDELCNGRDDDCDGTPETDVSEGPGALQAAIDAAMEGETLCVGPGTYAENLTIDGRNLRIIGRDGAASTFLDGGAAESVLLLSGGLTAVTLVQGFTVTNGTSATLGGGVRIEDSAPVLRDLIVSGNRALIGGGIGATGSGGFLLERVEVSDNEATIEGGGLALEADGTLSRLRITGNRAADGAGLAAGGAIMADNVRIDDNEATDSGGGIRVGNGATLALTHAYLAGNSAVEGGGISLASGTLDAVNVVFAGNAASGDGGAVHALDGSVTLRQATFDADQAGGTGGGIHLGAGASLAIENSIFALESAGATPSAGGALQETSSAGLVRLNYVDWFRNTPGHWFLESVGVVDPLIAEGCIEADPLFLGAAGAGAAAPWDHHLDTGSPAIDAGDPDVTDADGSRSDLGAFGGPGSGGWDLDGDGAYAWTHAGAYDATIDGPAGLDPDDFDATVLPEDDADRDGDGLSSADGDCDDTNPAIRPGAAEGCDGVDTDCDGAPDPSEVDADGDGWSPCLGDCDDATATIHPGAAESCDGVDEDCDGAIPSAETVDADGDGSPACADCNDGDPDRYPGAPEACNHTDDDCDDATTERWVAGLLGARIQKAIDAAADGDTVCVPKGTYTEVLTITDKSLRIEGTAGALQTIVDGGGSGPVLLLDTSSDQPVVVKGLTIRNGTALEGAGINGGSGSDLTLDGVIVSGNSATGDGGGILGGYALRLKDSIVKDNVAGGDGGGVHGGWYVYSEGAVTLRDNAASGDGGGLYGDVLTHVSPAGMRLTGNTATKGGGFYFRNVVDPIEGLHADANSAEDGAGGYVEWGTAILADVRLDSNSATGNGGGLFLGMGADITAYNVALRANSATQGGAVYMENFAGFTVVAGRFLANTATTGGAFFGGRILSLTSVAIVANEAATGAVAQATSATEVTLVNAAVTGNKTSGTGAVFRYSATATTTIRNCDFYGNAPIDLESYSPMSEYSTVALPAHRGNLAVDPKFLDCDVADPALDWDVHLHAGSPLVDAGWILIRDPDGSRSDIGAYGGARADGWDLDGDDAPQWWHPGAYDPVVDAAAGEEADDEDAGSAPTSAVDADGDGYSPSAGDCDDDDIRIHPGANELCDGVDTDCDGTIPADEADADGDGYRGCGGDCEDGEAAVHPTAVEACDGRDDDCDGTVPADESDADGDGHTVCAGDCDDADAQRHPGADEACGDGVDGDCDGAPEIAVAAAGGTIQAAIDAAAEGQTVCVEPGTYLETLVFRGRNIRVIGVDGAATTVIDADGAGPAVTMALGEGPATLLSGFTLTGGYATHGGGLYISTSSPTLRDLVVSGNAATSTGGGVWMHAAEGAVVSGLSVHDNTAGGSGGGLALVLSKASIEDVDVRDNDANDGGGFAIDMSTVTIAHARISGNSAATSGGGVGIDRSTVALEDAGLWNNEAASGGGLAATFASTLTVRRAAFLDNRATGDGGGLYLDDVNGTNLLRNVVVAGNVAAGDGGGLRVSGHPTGTISASTLAIESCSLVRNEAGASGGAAAFAQNNAVAFTGVAFSGNRAASGGAVHVDSATLPSYAYSGFWDNLPNNVQVVGGTPSILIGVHGNIAYDPDFVDAIGTDPTAWDLHLGAASHLIDAGDPAVHDPDGSRSDIGAYSGADAGSFDLDGDGFFQRWDAGPYAYPADAIAGLDDDDLDPDRTPTADVDGDGATPASGDCDDDAFGVHPGAAEACDGVDDDCDGSLSAEELDADGDGVTGCDGDCDDADPAVFPAATEACDGRDNDCDGSIDEDRCYTCTFLVPGDSPTIGGAMAAAIDGDVVCVAAGTYFENLDFGGKAIQVIGEDGPDVTVIDGGLAASVVRFSHGEGRTSVLQGFALKRGRALNGGGIYAEAAEPTIRSVIVDGCQATADGGGIYLTGSPVLLEDVGVFGCTASDEGGGIHARHSGFSGRRLIVSENSAGSGGGGILLTSVSAVPTAVDLTNLIVTANEAGLDGGGIQVATTATHPVTLTVVQASIAGNRARNGGGLYASTGATASLKNVDVSRNVATVSGGGIRDATTAGATLLFDNLYDNSPTDYAGTLGSIVGKATLLAVDPLYTDIASATPPREWDLHLQATSGLIDLGDWTLADPDGSRSDIGAYGGLAAARWDIDGDGALARWTPGPYDLATDLEAGLDPDDGDPALSPGGDLDGDSFSPATGDCDDTDALVHPGAAERCNGRDDDCDGTAADEGTDADDDGVTACQGDCDDTDALVHPGATEACNGKDDDCDGVVGDDEVDGDGDGYRLCDNDCDDYQAQVHPGATEVCDGQDTDCDGNALEGEWDWDGDNVPGCAGDCGPDDGSTYPGAPELCDGVDNDCDGTTAEETADADGDGYTFCGGDCDDADPLVRPNATERCNGKDDNCDGRRLSTEYDSDQDGWFKCNGDCADTKATVHPGAVEACDGLDTDCSGSVPATEIDADGDGWSVCEGDCDDTRAAVHPDAVEVCDGFDTDCDAAMLPDEGDADGDGFLACADDCDDGNAALNPAAEELCNGKDDSCGASAERRVPGDHATIGEALAASESADVVCVAAGVYKEHLDFGGRDVRVIGVAGASKTFVNALAGDSVVRFTAGETRAARLQGFTLVNGKAANGGGIFVKAASPTLRDLVLSGNEATGSGGGLYIENGSPLVQDVEVKGNQAGAAAGVRIYSSGYQKCDPEFSRLRVHHNTTYVSGNGYGGGFMCGAFGGATGGFLRDSFIEDNEAYTGGGLVIDGGCDTALERLVIAGNVARNHGGGVYTSHAGSRLSHAVLVGNRATGNGGAIALYGATPTWRHLVVLDNSAGGSNGAVACVWAGCAPEFYNTLFVSNASASGTDIGFGVLRGCHLWGNVPQGWGGTVVQTSPAPHFLSETPADDPRGWDLHLPSDSPLIDAGYAYQYDDDLSVVDPGLYGGTTGTGWDLDGDGLPAWWTPGSCPGLPWDCDD